MNPEETTPISEMEQPVEETIQEMETETLEADSQTDKLSAEVAELKDKYLRLYADFENFRRRTAKEKLDMMAAANEELMKAVLPVVDDFERAMTSFENFSEI
ncbi:MAG: nucleotide exchange factor GrpE, partial [Runella slithyformis]